MINSVPSAMTELLRAGALLTEQGLLDQAEDVFFIRVEEQLPLLSVEARDWRALVNSRKQARAADLAMAAPDQLIDEVEEVSADLMPEAAGWRGVPISAGLATGPVRIIRTLEDWKKVSPGDILVAPVIDPGMAPLFGIAAGLVAEMGGTLSHGAIMVAAAVAAWAASSTLGVDQYAGALIGIAVALVAALITYFAVVQPIQRSRRIANEEKEIFVLTGTLLWGIMIQELIAYLFTNNAKTVLPIVSGVVEILGVRTPRNEIFTALVCCLVIAGLWLLVNRTKMGKAVLAASMNPRGVTLLGLELTNIYVVVWAIYGVLAGIAGVLLGQFLGVSSYSVGPLTASAFSIVVLGGLGSVSGSLIAFFHSHS